MKRIKAICTLTLALLLTFSLAACGNDDLTAGNGSSSPTAGGSTDSMPQSGSSLPSSESTQPTDASTATVELKICTVNGSSICAVGLSEPYGEAYTFTCTPEQLTGAEALLPGMIVEAVCDEAVLETWPAQLQAHSVTVKERQPDYYSLYDQILEDIFAQDEALNSSAVYFGFDFTGVDALRENEKLLLAWNFSTAHSAEPLQGTIQELMDEGYIDEENLYWEDGVHFTIKEEKVEQSTVTFSVTKWRSGLGAIGYTNTASQDKHGEWVFQEISNMWIS